RHLPALPVGGLHHLDRVALGPGERAVDGGGDADLGVGAAGDRLVEPHALDERGVLDEAEQRGLRRHQAGPGLLLAQTIEAVVERGPVLVDELVDALGLVVGPAQPATTGSFSQPRTVLVLACTALSQSTSHSGTRLSTSSSASRPARRASAAPRQKWMP